MKNRWPNIRKNRKSRRMNEDTLEQMHQITRTMRRAIYRENPPEHMLLDLDSTLLDTCGKQEGEAFNYHYQSHGYHPLLCYDAFTGDLLTIGTINHMYCEMQRDEESHAHIASQDDFERF